MQVSNLNKKLLIFISFNIFYAIFYLHYKHHVGNDTSISEWLINYQGGFTRRGLGGEINIIYGKKITKDEPLDKIKKLIESKIKAGYTKT